MSHWDESVNAEGRHPSEELRDEIAALALGALSERESDELRAHIEHCEHCRAELEWLEPAVDLLPATVPQLSPPPALRARIMAEVERDSRPDPEPARTAPRRRFAFGLWRPAFGVAAAGVLALGVAVGVLVSGGSGPVTLPVEPSPAVSPAAAELTRDENVLTLEVHRLPSLEPGTVYQVWIMREGADDPIPSETFDLAADRSALVELGAVPEDAEQLLVTTEPAGGSSAPTSEPIMTAML